MADPLPLTGPLTVPARSHPERRPQPDPSSAAPQPSQGLTIRTGRDGSFSLWSERFGEGFHSGRGALREARETFLQPSELERFPPGSTLRVLEVCVGTGCNLAVLLEACMARELRLEWTGLELDLEPLALALAQPEFRRPWQARTLGILEQLQQQGEWHAPGFGAEIRAAKQALHGAHPPVSQSDSQLDRESDSESGSVRARGCGGEPDDIPGPMKRAVSDTSAEAFISGSRSRLTEIRDSDRGLGGGDPGVEATSKQPCDDTRLSRGRMLWGDARHMLQHLLQRRNAARFDLIWHDAFSPQRCPQLWTVEFLGDLTSLLGPQGRWISYCSAAAVREALRLTGLQLAALHSAGDHVHHPQVWSGGSVASPSLLPASPRWRALTPMELEHLASSAGEPYRDPTGQATAEAILRARQQAQAAALAGGTRGSSSAWRRRWGLEG